MARRIENPEQPPKEPAAALLRSILEEARNKGEASQWPDAIRERASAVSFEGYLVDGDDRFFTIIFRGLRLRIQCDDLLGISELATSHEDLPPFIEVNIKSSARVVASKEVVAVNLTEIQTRSTGQGLAWAHPESEAEMQSRWLHPGEGGYYLSRRDPRYRWGQSGWLHPESEAEMQSRWLHPGEGGYYLGRHDPRYRWRQSGWLHPESEAEMQSRWLHPGEGGYYPGRRDPRYRRRQSGWLHPESEAEMQSRWLHPGEGGYYLGRRDPRYRWRQSGWLHPESEWERQASWLHPDEPEK
jgi:hypothetical protein